MNCVPFSSASPSLGPSSSGFHPSFFKACALGMRLPASTTSPKPSMGRRQVRQGRQIPGGTQ
jgi:hypothetical protein